MSRTLDEIREDAMQLNAEERGYLVDTLFESFLTPEEQEIQEAWLDEAERRLADYEAGRTKSVPFEEVMRKLRARTGAKSRVS